MSYNSQHTYSLYIKIENIRTEKFRQKTSDKILSDAFSGISDKKLSDKHDIKKSIIRKYMVKIIVIPS